MYYFISMMIRRKLIKQGLFGVIALTAGPVMAGAPPKKKGGGSAYTQLPMLLITTHKHGGRRGNVAIELGVYAEDKKLTDQVKLYQPRLMDAYLSALNGYAQTLKPNTVINTDYVQAELQKATDTVIGKKGVKVLLGTIIVNAG
jgi:hypothetical protein